MKVVPIPVRSDNYAYLLIDESSNEAAAVDPYDVDKVIQAAQQNSVNIVSVLTTHHHFDHSGGNLVRVGSRTHSETPELHLFNPIKPPVGIRESVDVGDASQHSNGV